MAIQKITSNVLADGAVSATNLGDNSVTSAKLADSSVTSAKMSGALTTPSTLTLGGNLDVSGHDIVSASNAAIELDPNGSGVVTFKGNSTRGAGQFKLNCENNSHGITIKGPPHSAAASYTLTLPNTDGNADQVLKTNGSGVLDWVDSGGGGAWTVISSQTVSSAVASVEFTSGITGYTNYVLVMNDLLTANDNAYGEVQFAYNGNSSYETSNYTYSMLYTGYTGSTPSQQLSNASSAMSYAANMSASGPAFGKLWFGTGSSAVRSEFANKRGNENKAYFTTMSGFHNSNLVATSINKVKVRTSNGNIASGTFTLYGLANS